MRLNKFRKDPADRKRYVVDYADWLNEDETLQTTNVSGSVPADGFFVDAYTVDATGKQVIFYVSGGLSGKNYNVNVLVTTSLTQTKKDYVTFVVT
jgi:hypothetical protein